MKGLKRLEKIALIDGKNRTMSTFVGQTTHFHNLCEMNASLKYMKLHRVRIKRVCKYLSKLVPHSSYGKDVLDKLTLCE